MGGIRDIRVNLNLLPAQVLKVIISSPQREVREVMAAFQNELKTLGRLESLEIRPDFQKSKSHVANAFPDFEVFVAIEGLVDPEKERTRIEKKVGETENYIRAVGGKLADGNFVKNAPAEIVEKEREKLADAEKVLKSHRELLTLFQ